MNLTSLTALILTFHNVPFLLMLILALLITLLCYALFIRRFTKKSQALALVLFFSLMVGYFLSERVFAQKPLSFELVKVG